MLLFGGADDRCCHAWFLSHPGHCNVCARHAPPFRDPCHSLDHFAIGLLSGAVEALGHGVGFRASTGVGPGTSEPATSERAKRDDADALGLAKRKHLALLLAIEQV